MTLVSTLSYQILLCSYGLSNRVHDAQAWNLPIVTEDRNVADCLGAKFVAKLREHVSYAVSVAVSKISCKCKLGRGIIRAADESLGPLGVRVAVFASDIKHFCVRPSGIGTRNNIAHRFIGHVLTYGVDYIVVDHVSQLLDALQGLLLSAAYVLKNQELQTSSACRTVALTVKGQDTYHEIRETSQRWIECGCWSCRIDEVWNGC